jgi:hypothetical protein
MYRLLPLFLVLLYPGTTWSTTPSPAPLGDKEILAVLEEPFVYDSKDEMTLGKALRHIHETAKLEIFIDHRALKEVNVSVDSSVKFRLPFPLSLRDALDYLLKQHGLTWIVKNEMLTITTPKKAKGEWYSRTYYVGDLLQTTPPIKLPPTDPVDFAPIIDYIQTMVTPESWKEGGGSIQEYYPNLSLVIRQCEEEHDQIVELLSRLRKSKDLQIMFDCEVLTPTAGFKKGPV